MRSPTLLLSALLAACLLLGACGGQSPELGSRESDPLLLRQYPTPPDRSEAVANALNDVLGGTKTVPGVGRASSRVAGQVVVLAPASMQTSIAKTIESLVGNEAPSSPSNESVRLHYWFIEAQPGEGDADAGLAEVSTALTALEPSLGQVHFRLLDRVSLVAASRFGTSSAESGRGTSVQQTVEAEREGVRAAIQIRQRASSESNSENATSTLSVSLVLNLGETVLLSMVNANGGDDKTQRLVLLRAEKIGTP